MSDKIKPPLKLMSWLSHASSLTAKAQEKGHEVKVSVLSQQWCGRLFQRQIVMMSDEQPWWYGQTLIPYQTYQLRSMAFSSLANNPLGTILYRDPSIYLVQRHSIVLCADEFTHSIGKLFLYDELESNQLLWGRASIFNIENQPLYLKEIFLPEMLKCL